jgi:hypothetical protein
VSVSDPRRTSESIEPSDRRYCELVDLPLAVVDHSNERLRPLTLVGDLVDAAPAATAPPEALCVTTKNACTANESMPVFSETGADSHCSLSGWPSQI